MPKDNTGKTLGTTSARRARYASDAKANRWMITLNFGGEEEFDRMTAENTASLQRLNAAAQVPPTTYAIFQAERGENGTLHVQAYFEFEKRMTLAQVKKHVGDRCHLDPARGTPDECIAYCSKEDTRIEGAEPTSFGTPMKLNAQGRTGGSRTDWADVLRMIKSGNKIMDILEKHPAMIPNTRAILNVRFVAQCERSRSHPTKLLVLWGTPDSGKTTTAISLCDPGTYYVLPADGKSCWWDGYDPDRHQTVIIDEFVGSRMPLTLLNQICDTIDLNLQTKGGFVRFLAERVIITSNFSPREWYAACVEARQEALWRRIATEVEFQLRDEIIDMRGDASKTQPMLHLKVHKGHWNYGLTQSIYKFDSCCSDQYLRDTHALEEPIGHVVERLAATPEEHLDDSMDSEDEVQLRKTQHLRKRANYTSSPEPDNGDPDPIEISSEDEEERHFYETAKRQRTSYKLLGRSQPLRFSDVEDPSASEQSQE